MAMSHPAVLPSRCDSRSDGDGVWGGKTEQAHLVPNSPAGMASWALSRRFGTILWATCALVRLGPWIEEEHVGTYLHHTVAVGHLVNRGRPNTGQCQGRFGSASKESRVLVACAECLLCNPQTLGACIFDASSAVNRICHPTGRDCVSAPTVSARGAGGSGLGTCACELPFFWGLTLKFCVFCVP